MLRPRIGGGALGAHAAAALVAVVVLATGSPQASSAATYYVNPQTGNNANSGSSAAAPWRTPPGTRNVANSGFVSTAWGAITAQQKVACGDTVLLRGGTTQTSTHGGAWLIDATYYSTCGAANPIRIKVATDGEWSGSSGPFTIDGTGVTPAWSPTRGYYSHPALVSVADRGYVSLLGAGASQRLVVRGSSSWAVNVHCAGCTNAGFRGDWLELAYGAGGGFNIGNYTDWQVSNSVGHNLGFGAWQTGLNNDQMVERGAFVDVEAYRTGPSNRTTGADDAFFFVGGKSVWCVRCTSRDNNQRGVNTGVIHDARGVEFNYRFRDLRTWNNGVACSLTAPVLYCIGAGLAISGNDGAAPVLSRNTVVGALFYRNADAGTWNYGDGALEVWNATFYRTNYKREDTGSVGWDSTGNQLSLFNVVDQKTSGSKAFYFGNANVGPQRRMTPIIGNSCFRPLNSDSETLGIAALTVGTYATPPSYIGPTNLTGLNRCVTNFVAVHDSDYSRTDFRPASGSTLIDAGRFLLLANGAGQNATTVLVRSNGGSADPRQFFIDATSYLDPAPSDRQVQIEGCGVRTVVSLTSNSITFSPACSWANGAGISLPWIGARPDIGAYESGAAAPPPPPPPTGPPAPPTLLSVDPL